MGFERDRQKVSSEAKHPSSNPSLLTIRVTLDKLVNFYALVSPSEKCA